MQTNKLILLPINDLIKEKPFAFYIPYYQRGYRWTDRQVIDLLDDIREFINKKDRTKDEFYCLQPVVVKPNNDTWEVIDGQQRLTTIYLLLKYFNNRLAVDFQKPLYALNYETRQGSTEYLGSLSKDKSLTNVDFFHMFQAYTTINNWFKTKQNIVNDFEAILLNSIKVIWYEVTEEINSIDIFTRLNIGKIPLTNAELIKALFLLRDNFEGNDQIKQLRQLEIAVEWNRIESTLRDNGVAKSGMKGPLKDTIQPAFRDNEFWGFLSNNDDGYDNRIEFIFDLMSSKTKEDKKDKDFTFRYFYKRFHAINDVEIAWKEVKDYFLTFQEWYNDRELFHLVGFLILVGENVQTLKTASVGKTKKVFKELLKNNIKKYIAFQVSELSYEESSDRKKIKHILLLFNIVTIINNVASNYRFQFGRFKEENWDIEHIHSVKSNMPEREEHKKDWMNDVIDFIKDDELKGRIQTWIDTEKKNRTDEFETIYEDVLEKCSEKNVIKEINDITNLTLLDAGTNRGYKNAIFPVKRKKINQKDQDGTFIPLCTKNVFSKYYNESVDQMLIWGEEDRESYLKAILTKLENYLPPQTTN